jgi:hypothetical protein
MSDDEHSVRMIRLADGTLIDPLTRQPVGITQADGSAPSVLADPQQIDSDGADDPAASSLQQVGTIAPLARRSLLDLTLNAAQMAVVNNVLVYTLWGLPDDEIAIQCNCSVSDVHTVRDLDEYTRMHDALLAGMRQSYTASAHGIISKAAVAAARVVVSSLQSPSKRMQFDAAREVLDRSGHRAADHAQININLNKGTDDALVIRVVRESEQPHVPTLDLTVNNGA